MSGTEWPAASTGGAKCDAAVEISQGKNAVDAAKEVCLSVAHKVLTEGSDKC